MLSAATDMSIQLSENVTASSEKKINSSVLHPRKHFLILFPSMQGCITNAMKAMNDAAKSICKATLSRVGRGRANTEKRKKTDHPPTACNRNTIPVSPKERIMSLQHRQHLFLLLPPLFSTFWIVYHTTKGSSRAKITPSAMTK